ncbi:hypothetical protein VME0621_05078 [Vibrio mediterranei]|uniref:hypothetical protein n=1 Tax=Vibrio mediterranei TaxID=689 RepID=UPI0007816C5C|nr:hypothetical protein [Vibrio mediterranei]SBO12907.1 hypothetical protein VME0621_05078 [Vibrio mediterranei]
MQPELVFDAVRRGYNNLEHSSNNEIVAYFEQVNPDAMVGHISNVKGIVFEQEVAAALNDQGLDTELFEATNHAVTDIAIMNEGDIAAEVQLKATDSVSYINETLAEHPDVPIIVTSEVANSIDSVMVIDSGIGNDTLTQAVTETLARQQVPGIASDTATELGSDAVSEGLAEIVADVAIPVSPIGFGIGLLFGLPF